MTRANIVLKQKYFPKNTYLELGSDGYPSSILPELIKFLVNHRNKSAEFHKDLPRVFEEIQAGEFSDLVSNLFLKPGQVGNFSYAYEVDLINATIKVWDSTLYWVNVPEDWEEKGYMGISIGKNGKHGYTSWRKGKKLLEITLDEILADTELTIENETIKYKI